MKIKNGFVIEKVADSYLACATGELAESFNGFIRLNETGAFLWEQMQTPTTRDALIRALLAEYDVDAAGAGAAVDRFIAHLDAHGFLE